jgi:hypothetical protein
MALMIELEQEKKLRGNQEIIRHQNIGRQAKIEKAGVKRRERKENMQKEGMESQKKEGTRKNQ